MKSLIRVLFLMSLSGAANAVDFSFGLQHAGFLGEKVIFAGIENESRHLGLDLLLGRSEDSDGQKVDQFSLKFRYSPWRLDLSHDLQWQVVSAGLLATYTNGHEFFFDSEEQYPEKDYYDTTQIRFGLLVGTAITFKNLSLYTELVALDKTLESQAQSEGALKWQDAVSAAVGLRWNF